MQLQPQITDENQIELLSPETDSKPRLAKQAIFATLGALVLLLPLIPSWENTGLTGTILIIFALLVTPGLALDGLLFGGMRRINGSLIGITLATGAAWYAGLSSLLFTLGYKLDITMISTITSLTAIIAVASMIFTGQAVTRIRPEKADVKSFIVILISIFTLIVIAFSSWLVSVNVSILQPEGKATSVALKDENIDLQNPYNVKENNNLIAVEIKSNFKNNDEFVINFHNESDGKITASDSTKVNVPALNKTETVKLNMPEFVGCGTVSIVHGSTEIKNIAVKSSNDVTCKTVTVVDVFERLNIDTSGAPTGSLKELLNYLKEQGSKGNLSELPADYRTCIEKTDPDIVASCLDSIKS